MKRSNKFFSIGLLAIIISVLFINGFIQTHITSLMNGSTKDSNGEYPTIGNADMNYTIIYGHPSDLTVTKSESVTIDVQPNGSIRTQRVTVSFVFENDADENCSFDLIDRAEQCDLDTIKFQKGTFDELLKYEVLNNDEEFGVIVLKWSNITVKANSRAEYGYSIASYKPVPLVIETEYYVNGSLVEIDPQKNALNTSIGSVVSNIIRVRNIQQDYFSTSDAVKPTTICLVTLMLPFEEEEADRDFDEPIFSPSPIMANVLATIQQVSFLAIGDLYEINWTTTIRKGGGWGIIELQPLRVDVVQSSSIMGLLADGLSALLGVLAAQQAYWAALTLMAMIEQLTTMVGVLQVLLSQIELQLGLLHMMNYSVLSSLLMGLIEIDLMRSSLQNMYAEVNYTYYNDIVVDYEAVGEDVRSLFRTILGITEFPYIYPGLGGEGTWSNGATGIGYLISTGYMSIPLMIDYLSDVERRIVASIGAQLVELTGSPAVINMTSTTSDLSIYINATLFRYPDNTAEFYTMIQIINLTIPIEIIGIELAALNLSRTYEFRLNNVPGDRSLFALLDDYFGSPVILTSVFPLDYQVPGSPGSNFPGFYTWILDALQVGRSAIWWMIGNFTRSLSTLLLLLDSSFSDETLDLLDSALSGGAGLDLSAPITLEAGFDGISDLMGIFSELSQEFSSPFGSPFAELLPDMSSMSLPVGGSEMTILDQFQFWTALKVYMDPVPRIRQLLNISLPLDFGNMTAGMDTGSMMGGMDMSMLGGGGNAGTVENGQMPNWNWSYQGLVSATLSQSNTVEGSTDFKSFQFAAVGPDVNTGVIRFDKDLDVMLPASDLVMRFRTSNNMPDLSLVVVSQNASGSEVYAIRDHDLSTLAVNTWYEFTYDLESSLNWDYYAPSFDPDNIKGVELRIIPHITSTVNFDLDYLNFSRLVIPYPYDLTILDGYLIGEGIEVFPNVTFTEKWTTGLFISDLEIAEMNGDSVNDVIVGSNDGYIYLLDGMDGSQIWNYSTDGSIKIIHLENIQGDSTPEIIVGTTNGMIYVLDKNRILLNNFSVGNNLDFLTFANLTGTSNTEIITGQASNVSVYDFTGALKWQRTVKGNILDLSSADLTGDGLDEIALTTSKYKIYTLNGTNGNIIWDIITDEIATFFQIGNFQGDSKGEIIYTTDLEDCIMLDGNSGNQILNFTSNSPIFGLLTANLNGDEYDDILLHSGKIIGHNLSAITTGPSINLIWNFFSITPFSLISPLDYYPAQPSDEILLTLINNSHYLLDNSGAIEFNFTTSRTVSQVKVGELTQTGNNEFVLGLSNNHISVIDGDNLQSYWMNELGEEIITFQFIRTNSSITLLYNLPDPISDMTDMLGFSMGGMLDLTSLTNLDLSLGTEGLGGAGISLGGLGSIGGTGGGFDLGSMNFTISDLPLNGIGLINMLEFEITLIAQLQDMKQVASTQRAFTGVHEVRYTDKDSIDYELYPIISDEANSRNIQYKIRNYEEQTITAQYFALNMTYAGEPLPIERLIIEGWNGTNFVNLGNNPIHNITISQLGLNYTNGILLFKPFLEVDELEKALLTVDWAGRDLRVKIDTSSLDLNQLRIEPWVDVSIQLAGITTPGVSSVISFSKTIPTYIVTATPTPNITDDTNVTPFLELLMKSPAFWALSTTGLVAVFGLGYMKKREDKEVKVVASRKIMKWLKKRERSWQTLVQADIMTPSQFHELRRIRYRIGKENLTQTHMESSWDKILKFKFIGEFLSTVLMMRFWRRVGQKSRLVLIMDTLEHMVLDPLKHAWATFKTTLGYLNPWDMDRQRKKELLKKAANKRYWKKIEAPRKPIRKKRVEIITSPPSTGLSIDESIKLKVEKTKEKSKKKGTSYMTDGGTLLKKISKAKRLPAIGSRDGQIFYTLTKRKYVGMTLKELSKELDLPEYEILVSLIRLLEKGLIFLLQEGRTVSEDIWDVTSSLRKYDSELDKLIESIEGLDDELNEGMEYLKTEIDTEKKE